MKSVMASILQIAGIGGTATGLYMLAPWLGVVVGGVGLVALGFAIDPPKRGPKS